MSSTESSSMSIHSGSSCGASGSHVRGRAPSTLAFQHGTSAGRRFNAGTVQPPSSPHESKPVLAVKGIAAPTVTRLTPPASKYASPRSTNPTNSPVTEEEAPPKFPAQSKEQQRYEPSAFSLSSSSSSSSRSSSEATSSTNGQLVQSTATVITAPTKPSGSHPAQSPTVGVVSPMMNHRVIKVPQLPNSVATGNQLLQIFLP
ncbi:unnamed protein product [Gongylonema pulchrum]|uniref:Uncharacterized protein n=1 Tax=Gongylonema pulchrum TaxID=637853 RepID=A0A3P7NGD1_9BILA|nr:unnamed protein product [Gongylonema pulchrum]